MTDPLAKGHAEEGALEIHTNVLDLIIIKFICMVMCFKWSLLPTNDKQSTKLSLSRGRRRSRRLRAVCPMKSVNIPCSNGSLELLSVSVLRQADRQRGLRLWLSRADLSWAEFLRSPSSLCTTSTTPTSQCTLPLCYVPFLVCCLLFVVLLLLLDALNGQKVALLGVGDVSCTPVHCSLMMSLKISTKINYEYRKDVPWKSAHRHAHTRTQRQSCLCCFDKTFFISFHLESESASAEPGLPFATLSLFFSPSPTLLLFVKVATGRETINTNYSYKQRIWPNFFPHLP